MQTAGAGGSKSDGVEMGVYITARPGVYTAHTCLLRGWCAGVAGAGTIRLTVDLTWKEGMSLSEPAVDLALGVRQCLCLCFEQASALQ